VIVACLVGWVLWFFVWVLFVCLGGWFLFVGFFFPQKYISLFVFHCVGYIYQWVWKFIHKRILLFFFLVSVSLSV